MDTARWLSLGGGVAAILVIVGQRYLPGARARLVRSGRWREPEWDVAIVTWILVAVPVAVVLAIVLDDHGAGAVLIGIAIGVIGGLCAARAALVLSRRSGWPRG